MKKRLQNEELSCPDCRNKLPLQQWKQKLDYEDNRKEIAEIMNKLYQLKLEKNLDNSVKKIYERFINNLKHDINVKNDLIKKYREYDSKIIYFIKNMLNEFN